jgi:hypothetical protein
MRHASLITVLCSERFDRACGMQVGYSTVQRWIRSLYAALTVTARSHFFKQQAKDRRSGAGGWRKKKETTMRCPISAPNSSALAHNIHRAQGRRPQGTASATSTHFTVVDNTVWALPARLHTSASGTTQQIGVGCRDCRRRAQPPQPSTSARPP